jgi:hypothetical protein
MADYSKDSDCHELPDWAGPVDQAREAYDYEENARYDRFDGWGDPDNAEEWADQQEYDALTDEERRAEEAEVEAERARALYDGYPDEADVPF